MSIFDDFYGAQWAENAQPMAAYMRNQFDFLGIRAPERRNLTKCFLKEARQAKEIDWTFVQKCWRLPEREFQYLAVDYLRTLKKSLTRMDLPQLEQLVTSKSWWDTVDNLAPVFGWLASQDPEVAQVMLAWSLHDNVWLRRVAIIHQLGKKIATDTELLAQILVNNLSETEFFINKAMGWALRDFSKTNPVWVKAFIAQHQAHLTQLTIREGSKYL